MFKKHTLFSHLDWSDSTSLWSQHLHHQTLLAGTTFPYHLLPIAIPVLYLIYYASPLTYFSIASVFLPFNLIGIIIDVSHQIFSLSTLNFCLSLVFHGFLKILLLTPELFLFRYLLLSFFSFRRF